MAWFSPLKGAYPSLTQVDRTLPAYEPGEGEARIVRGSAMVEDIDAAGEKIFRLANASDATNPKAYVYFCLPMGGQDDFQAGMAGTVGQGSSNGRAAVTGLAVGNPGEFQTDQFDKTANLKVNDLLTVGDDGVLTLHTSGANVVGQVTAAPFERYVNNAVDVDGRRTGAMVEVINFRTMWIPTLTTQ